MKLECSLNHCSYLLARIGVICALLVASCGGTDKPRSPLESIPQPELDRSHASIAALRWDWHETGFAQLMLNGALRVKYVYEVPPLLHTAHVTPEELQQVLELAADEELVQFFRSSAECDWPEPVPTDGGSSIFINTAAVVGESPVCIPEMGVLSSALWELGKKYFPRQ